MKPTAQMIAYYQQRTDQHIARVRHCLHLLAEQTAFADELRERAAVHDASKYSEAERIPYIWLTEYHRCRQNNEPFSYPDGMEAQVQQAVTHHINNNRHHPGFHAHPNDMSDVDIIEMVCDWTAMALEMGEDGGSARGWADKTVGNRIKFNAERTRLLYATIDLLDAAMAQAKGKR